MDPTKPAFSTPVVAELLAELNALYKATRLSTGFQKEADTTTDDISSLKQRLNELATLYQRQNAVCQHIKTALETELLSQKVCLQKEICDFSLQMFPNHASYNWSIS